MLLKNKSPRLITININTNIEDSINLMPAGEAVPVPDSTCKTRYVKALIKSKAIEEVEGQKSNSDDPLGEMTVKDLKAYADGLEIEYDSNIKKPELKKLIESHQE
tara:strand:- start:245 stop:559 length:315 start_codon:yes stop_codon:yes gene_type:complete